MDGEGGAAKVGRRPFGTTPDGTAVEAITLSNGHGIAATVISYGATLQALVAPDRDGRPGDIALGFADTAAYVAAASYTGATVGRFANRIAHGRFALDGRTYQLARNDHGRTALHGGERGFDKRVWEVVAVGDGAVELRLVSDDGDQGYPGRLTATATYALDADTLTLTYRATTTAPTIVNLSNHALFNLAGEGAPDGALGNRLTLAAAAYLPVDADQVPLGGAVPVAGTAFDFRRPRAVAEHVRDVDPQLAIGRGYDHNMVLDGTSGGLPRFAARLEDPGSGRVLEIATGQPGLQFYSGNGLDGTTTGKSGRSYRQGDGIALEPQHFPDAPNRPDFAGVRLDPGEAYVNTIVYRLTTAR